MEKLKIKKEDMIDLNEANVKKVFSRCKANPATLPQNLFTSKLIFSQDSALQSRFTFAFDGEKVKKYKAQIEFLIGQLLSIHLRKTTIPANHAAIKYDQSAWTTDPNAIISLFSLANAALFVGPGGFINNELYFTDISQYLKPTVSPNDSKLSDFVEIISGKEPEAH